ncbi:MAG: threonine synthase [Lactobacillus sp.]|jgi:threonine synthase|nr:threonine synthase [Lactobacillus sp.]
MSLQYRSTRGNESNSLTASQAILQGLAPDSGLYVPVTFPKLTTPLKDLVGLSYQDLALQILKLFLDDYTDTELKACITAAYGDQFDTDLITPVHQAGNVNYLELYHGPTLAFKDIALQLLPHLMTTAMTKNNYHGQITILTATSGDTGKAAMAGFADVPNTRIIIFYPKDGVSAIQKQQMVTQTGANVNVLGIDGNFDDAQRNVKTILNDQAIQAQLATQNIQFSSANSINIGRLIPQIVYYFAAYSQLVQNETIALNDEVVFSVPTGNFGDILAGWYAKKLGLPIKRLLCASNENNILTDFFHTGTYNKKRAFHVTSSPSMDILVSSNLERLLFEVLNEDPTALSAFMHEFETAGSATLPASAKAKLADFVAYDTDQAQTLDAIRQTQTQANYTIDPHTAVATHGALAYLKDTKDTTPMVILSTANPYKFPETVLWALTAHKPLESGFEAIQAVSNVISLPVPKNISRLKRAKVRFDQTIAVAQMAPTILNILTH